MNQGHFSIISITKNPAERIVKREASSVRIPHFFGIFILLEDIMEKFLVLDLVTFNGDDIDKR